MGAARTEGVVEVDTITEAAAITIGTIPGIGTVAVAAEGEAARTRPGTITIGTRARIRVPAEEAEDITSGTIRTRTTEIVVRRTVNVLARTTLRREVAVIIVPAVTAEVIIGATEAPAAGTMTVATRRRRTTNATATAEPEMITIRRLAAAAAVELEEANGSITAAAAGAGVAAELAEGTSGTRWDHPVRWDRREYLGAGRTR